MASADVAALYAASQPGDTLLLQPGVYDQPACFPGGYNRAGVQILPVEWGAFDADPMGGGSGVHHARFGRTVTFLYRRGLGGPTSTISAPDVTIAGIHHTTAPGFWPADNTTWGDLVGDFGGARHGMILLAGGAHRSRVLFCEFSTGYGTTKEPYQIDRKYIDDNSPSTWDFVSTSGPGVQDKGVIQATATGFAGWGDTEFLTHNRRANGPVAIQASSYQGDSFTFYGNYSHDMTGVLALGRRRLGRAARPTQLGRSDRPGFRQLHDHQPHDAEPDLRAEPLLRSAGRPARQRQPALRPRRSSSCWSTDGSWASASRAT